MPIKDEIKFERYNEFKKTLTGIVCVLGFAEFLLFCQASYTVLHKTVLTWQLPTEAILSGIIFVLLVIWLQINNYVVDKIYLPPQLKEIDKVVWNKVVVAMLVCIIPGQLVWLSANYSWLMFIVPIIHNILGADWAWLRIGQDLEELSEP
ncbi:MAG TPA: hypothetical protein VLI92_00110 [Candidatus Saccharimonadales bacterium]|nr:hypothetical protein [Candidatus Saccharimonadales bacterium]